MNIVIIRNGQNHTADQWVVERAQAKKSSNTLADHVEQSTGYNPLQLYIIVFKGENHIVLDAFINLSSYACNASAFCKLSRGVVVTTAPPRVTTPVSNPDDLHEGHWIVSHFEETRTSYNKYKVILYSVLWFCEKRNCRAVC